ncbi:MAG TPA: 2-oxoglutarate dehydrogenase, E2 component, dihydrolipoamide succinyltransferase [Pseudonocardiaceae bacterium]|nr:2-oxoglutarate dehydrogenase, E2 component, dihydrolipoamide succinyltransferase [Pseudonocardiaceae bacterium]
MAYSVEMPALGESVTEGTVTRWLKQEGETVEVDEPLVEVSTDKVDTEIPSPAAGVLQRIVVPEDETVEVGAELAVIGDSSSRTSQQQLPPGQQEQPQRAQQQPTEQQSAPPQPAQPQPAGGGSSSDSGASNFGGSESGSGTSVTMPALGESVTSGTVTRWLKQIGDTVEVDEPLLEVSTDKVDTEIPSPAAGALLEIVVAQDETAEVGAKLATIGDSREDQAPAEADQPDQSAQPEAGESPRPSRPIPASHTDESGGAPYVTPLVRKLAAEHGIDLSGVQGTGVGGRIRKQDVLAAVEAPQPEEPQPEEPQVEAAQPAPEPAAAPPSRPAPQQATPAQPAATAAELRGKTEKMSRMRSVIAKRMVESLQISAQLTTVVEADVTRLARLRDRAKRDFEAREGVKLSFLPFFAQATVEALKQHPKVNASIDTEQGQISYHGAEHLGIAVDTDRGLLVPVIHEAGDLNIAGLARRIADLAERTRANKITPDEMSGGTFTISNTGSRGALFDTPIILQPQVGILGTGSVVKRPVVLSGEDGDTIAVRSITYLALSYDHRLVDGADAARFLNTIKQRLTEAAFEADLGL